MTYRPTQTTDPRIAGETWKDAALRLSSALEKHKATVRDAVARKNEEYGNGR